MRDLSALAAKEELVAKNMVLLPKAPKNTGLSSDNNKSSGNKNNNTNNKGKRVKYSEYDGIIYSKYEHHAPYGRHRPIGGPCW